MCVFISISKGRVGQSNQFKTFSQPKLLGDDFHFSQSHSVSIGSTTQTWKQHPLDHFKFMFAIIVIIIITTICACMCACVAHMP